MNTLNPKLIIAALVGIIVGAGAVAVMGDDRGDKMGWHRMSDGKMMDDASMGMHDMMGDMMAELTGKTGDEFDKAFLAEMIVHHEGAVDMAEAALTSAKHTEIKKMAEAIISAQTTEIEQMKGWQKSWYGI